MNKVSIIILTYNNLDYSKDCINSIRKYTEEGTYEVIVVDNYSTDGTREWLSQQNDMKVVLNEENVGFPKGCNIGIKSAEDNNDILLLNNDTIVTTNWLKNLQICLNSSDDIGVTGAVSLSTANLQGVNFTYNDFEEMQILAEKNNISDSKRWEEKLKLIGFCMLIKREVLNKIGLLDERFSPGYYEDDDLGLNVINAGYKLMLCHDCFIHHYLGTSFRKDYNKFVELLNINQQKFVDKWGFTTHAFDDLRGDLMRVIEEKDKNKKLNILDMGCGLGTTLLKLKYEYPNSVLYGIENDKFKATIAEKIVELSRKKIGQFPLEFPIGQFDYIIVNNNIEKMDNPEEFLFEVKKYLKKDGRIIAAFQNVMHYKVIKDLLEGTWHYSQSNGIDKDNKSFFTSNDIYKLFDKCGYINPLVFHWYSWIPKEDNDFIEKLCSVSSATNDFFFRTATYAVKFENNELEIEKEKINNEFRYILRRIENNIDLEKNLKIVEKYYLEELVDSSYLKNKINEEVINKDEVQRKISEYIEGLIFE